MCSLRSHNHAPTRGHLHANVSHLIWMAELDLFSSSELLNHTGLEREASTLPYVEAVLIFPTNAMDYQRSYFQQTLSPGMSPKWSLFLPARQVQAECQFYCVLSLFTCLYPILRGLHSVSVETKCLVINLSLSEKTNSTLGYINSRLLWITVHLLIYVDCCVTRRYLPCEEAALCELPPRKHSASFGFKHATGRPPLFAGCNGLKVGRMSIPFDVGYVSHVRNRHIFVTRGKECFSPFDVRAKIR